MRQKQLLLTVDDDPNSLSSSLATFVPDENNLAVLKKVRKSITKKLVKFGPKKEPKPKPPQVPGLQLPKKRGRPPKNNKTEYDDYGADFVAASNIFVPDQSDEFVNHVPTMSIEPPNTVESELVNWPIMSSEAAAAAVNGPIETAAADILNWPMVAATELLYRQIMEQSPEIEEFDPIEKVPSFQLLVPSPISSPQPQQQQPSQQPPPLHVHDEIKVRNPCENFDLDKCKSARVHLERLDETKWPSCMLMDLLHDDHNYSQNDSQSNGLSDGSSSSSSPSNSNSQYMDTVTVISYNDLMDLDNLKFEPPPSSELENTNEVIEENEEFCSTVVVPDRHLNDVQLCGEKFESKNKFSNNNNNVQPQNCIVPSSQPKSFFLTPPLPPPLPPPPLLPAALPATTTTTSAAARKRSIESCSPSPEKGWFTLSIAGYPTVQAIVVDHSRSGPVMLNSDEEKENLIFHNGMVTCHIIPAAMPCHQYSEPEKITKKEQKEERVKVIQEQVVGSNSNNGGSGWQVYGEEEKVNCKKRKIEPIVVTSNKKDEHEDRAMDQKDDDQSQIDDQKEDVDEEDECGDDDVSEDIEMEMTSSSDEEHDDEETESETETMYGINNENVEVEEETKKEPKKKEVKTILPKREEKPPPPPPPPPPKEEKVEKKQEEKDKSTAVVETRTRKRGKKKLKVPKLPRPRKRKGSKLSLLEENRFVCVLCRDNHGMLKTFKNRNTLYNHRSVYHRNGDDSPALTSPRRRKKPKQKPGRSRRRRKPAEAAA